MIDFNAPDRFALDELFIAKYAERPVPFGFGALSEVVYLRTYSRIKEDGTNERWHETIRRVVEGTYNMQRRWCLANHLPWSDRKAQRSAQEMYERMFTMKFLPPGRGLWAMGSPLTEDRQLWAALNNCAFVSTKDLATDLAEPFCFLMEASMLGIGVGFDTKGAGQLKVCEPTLPTSLYHNIPDTREGWVESVRLLLHSYFEGGEVVDFGYADIRPAGAPIKGFGGVAAGPGPLREMHEAIRTVLDENIGRLISSRVIVDIMNLIGKCVVAGNVRRTAEISLGSPEDHDYLDLKNYEVNPERAAYGWTSNNSVFCEPGMDYKDIARRTQRNGEPGYVWLDNMQRFGRMGDPPNDRDRRADGTNPCAEQTLESYELCCLVETFPSRHESYEDFRRTLKFAYMYAKTVTLGRTPWPKTNAVLLRNRRIGLSDSGIVQAIAKFGIHKFKQFCRDGYDVVQYYDRKYSDWLTIPRSIKTTSVKPSGTISLLVGATAGKHFPESRFMVRRVRLSVHSDLVQPLRDAGYPVEPCVGDVYSVVVEFPIQYEGNIRTRAEVSMWEKLELAAFLQENWSDNMVSATIDFDPATEGSQVERALEYYQYRLKAISFLPRIEEGAYPQMPEESVSEDEYLRRVSQLRPVNFRVTHEKAEAERFCDGDACVLA